MIGTAWLLNIICYIQIKLNINEKLNIMPNIKIYGVSSTGQVPLYKKIKELFIGEEYAKDMVVTFMNGTTVLSLDGKSQPYIQLEITSTDKYLPLMTRLEELGYDIQVIELRNFIPKKEWQKKYFVGLPWALYEGLRFFYCTIRSFDLRYLHICRPNEYIQLIHFA